MKKKIFGVALAVACAAVLASCGDNAGPAKMTIVDANGNVVEKEIVATEDAGAVVDAVEVLLNAKPNADKVKAIKGVTIKGDASASVTTKVLQETYTCDLTVSFKSSEVFDFTDLINFDKLGLEESVTAELKTNIQDVGTIKVETNAFTKNKVGYVSVSAKANDIDQSIKYSYDYSELAAEAEEQAKKANIQAEINKSWNEISNPLADIFENVMEDALSEEAYAEFVKNGAIKFDEESKGYMVEAFGTAGITIEKTYSDAIVFGFNFKNPENENDFVAGKLKLSTETFLPLSVELEEKGAVKAAVSEMFRSPVYRALELPVDGMDFPDFAGPGATSVIQELLKGISADSAKLSVTFDYSASLSNKSTDGYEALTDEMIQSVISSVMGGIRR